MQKLTAFEKILYKELYRKSFYDFVKAFWHTCDPAPFIDGKLVQFYCEVFQYFCKQWVPYEEIKITILLKQIDKEITLLGQHTHHSVSIMNLGDCQRSVQLPTYQKE